MSIGEYLSPLIQRDNNCWQRFTRQIKNYFILLWHSLGYHESAKFPAKTLPNIININKDELRNLIELSKNIYEDSINRIYLLEKKSLSLVTYISVNIAFVTYLFLESLKYNSIVSAIILFISLLLVLISILNAFRCTAIKTRNSVFIDSVFDFNFDNPRFIFSSKKLIKEYLSSAIYNENIADNIADIYKSARNNLVISFLIAILGCILYYYFNFSNVTNSSKNNSPNNINVIKKNYFYYQDSGKSIDSNLKLNESIVIPDSCK